MAVVRSSGCHFSSRIRYPAVGVAKEAKVVVRSRCVRGLPVHHTTSAAPAIIAKRGSLDRIGAFISAQSGRQLLRQLQNIDRFW
jgi:hypothetical protein